MNDWMKEPTNEKMQMLFKSKSKKRDTEYDYLRPSPDDSREDLREKLSIIEEELRKVEKSVREYSQRMLLFGFTAWIFGLASFFSVMLFSGGVELIFGAPPLVKSLFVGAIAIPFGLTALLATRLRRKMEWSLKDLRGEILSSYHRKVMTFFEERRILGSP